MSDRVTVAIEQGVADVRLNRPDKLNALDRDMFRQLVSTGRSLATDDSVRAVVLSGAGRAFCAGLDFESFQDMTRPDPDDDRQSLVAGRGDSPANFAQQAAFVWSEMPAPVLAAVHGFAYGGGLQIALGADLRLVAAGARLSVMEIKWGLIPDMGGTQSLRRLVRLDVAKELTLTGRMVSGSEAVEIGLATRVSGDPYREAMALAREIASRSPQAVRAAKRLLNASGLVSLSEGLRMEAELQATLLGTPNQIEAVMANFQKRPPVFQDPD